MSNSTSRYSNSKILTYKNDSGKEILYKERRFISRNQTLDLEDIKIEPYERLDNVSARVIGDPLQYWRICDSRIIFSPLEVINNKNIVNSNTRIQ